MGNCLDCLNPSQDEATPSPATRRRQQEDAALKRQNEAEGRGVKDPEGLKRKQQKREAAEKAAEQHGQGEDGLKPFNCQYRESVQGRDCGQLDNQIEQTRAGK